MKLYKITCILCGTIKEVSKPDQQFCTRKCSGKYNSRKRKYKKRIEQLLSDRTSKELELILKK